MTFQKYCTMLFAQIFSIFLDGIQGMSFNLKTPIWLGHCGQISPSLKYTASAEDNEGGSTGIAQSQLALCLNLGVRVSLAVLQNFSQEQPGKFDPHKGNL